MTLKIDFENQILALFDGYFWPFNKSHEKIKSIFVISAIILSIWNVFIKFRWRVEMLIGALGNRLLQNPVANSNDCLFCPCWLPFHNWVKILWEEHLSNQSASGCMGFSSNVRKVEKNETSWIYKCFRKYFYQICFARSGVGSCRSSPFSAALQS